MITLQQYINLIRQVIASLVQQPLLSETSSKYGEDRFHTAEYSAYGKDEDGNPVMKHVVRASLGSVKAVFYCNTQDRWEACVKALARRTATNANSELSLPTPAYEDQAQMAEFIGAFNAVIDTHGKGFRASLRDEDSTNWLDFPEAQEMMLDANVQIATTNYLQMVANPNAQATPEPAPAPTPDVAPQAVPQPATVQPVHNAVPNTFA